MRAPSAVCLHLGAHRHPEGRYWRAGCLAVGHWRRDSGCYCHRTARCL